MPNVENNLSAKAALCRTVLTSITESLGPGHECPLGEEGVCDKTAGELGQLILERVYRPQIYACDAVVIVHVLEIVWGLAP